MSTFEIDIDSLYCPITCEIYNEPVLSTDGFIYEKDALEVWFENHNTSPKTSEIINNKLMNIWIKILAK